MVIKRSWGTLGISKARPSYGKHGDFSQCRAAPFSHPCLGCCLQKQLHILSDDAARQTNGLCFKLFMAPLLFYNVYSTDLASAYSWKLLVFCVVGTLAEFAFGLLLIPHIEPSRPAQGVMLQAFCRPNIVLLGLPLSTALFGPENIGHIAFMLAVLVPLINILAVLALELFRGGTPKSQENSFGCGEEPFCPWRSGRFSL